MAELAGKSGTVRTAANTHLKVTRWSFSSTTDAVDTTGMSDAGYRTFISGLIGATFSFDAVYDTTGVTGRPPDITTDASMAFQLETDAVPDRTLSGSCIITAATWDATVEGIVTYSAEATVIGSWVEA